jgi:hypothetical protein
LQKYSSASFLTRGGKGLGEVGVRDPLEVGAGNVRGPALGREHLRILLVVEGLIGEEAPLHQVHEVGADVVEPLALLVAVEEPGGPDVGRARHHLHEVVDAFHVDAGLLRGSGHDLPEDRRVAHQLALELVRDLEPLGHDVEGHEALLVGGGQSLLEGGEVGGLEDPGLVHQHVKAASSEACTRPIFPRFRPERTTTLPGFSATMRARKSGPVWASICHAVGLSLRRLNRDTRAR